MANTEASAVTPDRNQRTTSFALRFMSLLQSQKIENGTSIYAIATMTVGKIFVAWRMVYESFTVASSHHKICQVALLSRANIVASQRTTERAIFIFFGEKAESDCENTLKYRRDSL